VDTPLIAPAKDHSDALRIDHGVPIGLEPRVRERRLYRAPREQGAARVGRPPGGAPACTSSVALASVRPRMPTWPSPTAAPWRAGRAPAPYVALVVVVCSAGRLSIRCEACGERVECRYGAIQIIIGVGRGDGSQAVDDVHPFEEQTQLQGLFTKRHVAQ